MRSRPPAPLPRPELARLPVHLVARDYPETLAVFREFGVDLRRDGGGPVMESIEEGAAGQLLDSLADLIAWRDRALTP